MADRLRDFVDHYEDRARSARAWRESGGRVVGYLCDSVPDELIAAAGFLPFRLSGDPGDDLGHVERHVTPHHTPFTKRGRMVGFVASALNQLLAGELDFLDYLVVPHTRKQVQGIYRQLLLAQEVTPDLRLPELYYLDKAYSTSPSAARFDGAAIRDFVARLEEWSGRPLAPDAVAEAIREANRGKELLAQVDRLRRGPTPRISGVQALQIFGSAAVMPRWEHNRALAELLDHPPESPPTGRKVRIYVGGSPQDHAGVYDVIESLGAVVVGEDHCWGRRCAEWPAREDADPVAAVAARYHARPACSISFPLERTVARCTAHALAANVDGAIFHVLDGDEAQLWETPDEIRALEAANVPCLHLAGQPYRVDRDRLREEIAPFVDMLSRTDRTFSPA